MASNLQRKTNRNALNVSEVEKEIRELKAENEYLRAVLDNKKYQYDKEKSNLQTQLDDLRNKQDVDREIAALRNNNQTLAQEVEEASSEVRELTEISATLQKQLEDMKALHSENVTIQEQLEQLQNQVDGSATASEIRLEYERLTNHVVELKHRLNELIKERNNAKAQFDEAKKKLEDAKAQLT
ncbi:hypothetical protein AMK59_16 [Oryctes borbonicus]|uniref:Uncharacterized protein n=1 Tax=Oryctes borbonicus TaxID=1629725 RepID=A0A0T6BHD4_9SCAR|nr:hypothetical protein AMK59_16 [Oryctes borbonicus]